MLPAHFSCVVRAKSRLLSSRPSMTRRELGKTVDEGRNRKLMLLSSPGIALLCRTTRNPRFGGTVYAADSWYWNELWKGMPWMLDPAGAAAIISLVVCEPATDVCKGFRMVKV